jgi:hypothetical protein
VAGHAQLMGFMMVMLVIPLLVTGNHWVQSDLKLVQKALGVRPTVNQEP